MNVRTRDSASLERRLFAILLLLNAAVCAFQIAARRMPRGHDTFGNYVLSYLFMSHAAQGGGIAQWLPGVSHGMVSNWMFETQGGLFQLALLSIAELFRGLPFLPLYQLGMFADELLLLTGLWRLGRRFYASPYTLFFVGIAATGSHLWANHVYFNHRLLTGIPMILSLLHDFLDTGSRLKLFLGVNLLVLQFMGNATYVVILIFAAVFVYFSSYVWFFRNRWPAILAALRPNRRDLLWIPVNLVVLAAVSMTVFHGTGEVSFSAAGRNPSGTVPLDGFLTYGRNLNPLRFVDFFLGISPSLDFTLYCGILTIACAVLAIFFRPSREVLHLIFCLLLALLFSLGYLSFTGMTSYYLVPPLWFFRYVSLAAPLVKLLLILLAGRGFEHLVSRLTTQDQRLNRLGFILAGVALLVILGVLVTGGEGVSLYTSILNAIASGVALRPASVDERHTLGLLVGFSLAAAVLGILLAVRNSPRFNPSWILPALLLVHAADLFRWKVQMLLRETLPLNSAQWEVQRIGPIPYVAKRSADYSASRRFQALHPALLNYGATYDVTDSFLHLDPPVSRFLTSMALRGVSDIRRFPPRPSALSKIVGESREKIQVFSTAHVTVSDEEFLGLLQDPGFAGDILLLGPERRDAKEGADPVRRGPILFSADERLEVPHRVLHFELDTMKVEVELPADRRGAWLLYADAWHPEWIATVNGRRVRVERGFLAYKAVPLQPGTNVVEFRFECGIRAGASHLLGLNAILWIGILAATIASILAASGPGGQSLNR